MKPVASPDSFLPPHFGLLDRPEVRVVDHAVLIDLRGGHHPTGGQHGVLLLSSRIILRTKWLHVGEKRQENVDRLVKMITTSLTHTWVN